MLKKRYLKTKPKCKVSFKLSKEKVGKANRVNIVGSFNDWDESATEMNKLKSGDFSLRLNLDTDKNYEFRYLVDGEKWLNEEDADGYVDTEYNTKNCILHL